MQQHNFSIPRWSLILGLVMGSTFQVRTMKTKDYITVITGILVLLLTTLGLHAKAVGEPALCASHSNEVDRVDATIVALLPLHQNGMCNEIRLKPLQQLAAMQLTLAELNNATGDQGLKIGFLGPEDDDMLEEVKKVTGVFNLTHSSSLASALMASSRSPCVSDLRAMTADACDDIPGLLPGLPTVGVVVIASPEWLANLLHCIRSASESHTYLLVSSETGILPVLALHNNLPNAILVMQEISPVINGLQEQLTKSPMWDEYLHQQRCNYSNCGNTEVDVSEYALVQDPSVTPMTQAVKLYARALRIVHKLKCGNKPGRCALLNELASEEWRGTLRSASERGIRFYMEQRSFHHLYYKSPFSYDLEKVGNITDGGRHVSIRAGLQLAASHHAVCKETARFTSPTTAVHTTVPSFIVTTHIPTHATIHERSDISKKINDGFNLWFAGPNFNILDINSYSMPELIIALGVFACVLAALFSLLIYAVYSNFKVKGNDDRSRDGSSRRSSVRSN
ncbi:hypothetical protein B566_EDAN001506 [Ephemera danica]|nr:hypothetical protein B566_EDAN001506 [Ephemera danica]